MYVALAGAAKKNGSASPAGNMGSSPIDPAESSPLARANSFVAFRNWINISPLQAVVVDKKDRNEVSTMRGMVGLVVVASLVAGCGNKEKGTTSNGTGGATGSDGDESPTAIVVEPEGGWTDLENQTVVISGADLHPDNPELLGNEKEHLENGTPAHEVDPGKPDGLRHLFATGHFGGELNGTDGPISTYDPFCSVQDDSQSCPDGYYTCGFSQCASCVPKILSSQVSSCDARPFLGTNPIKDPCDLWYLREYDDKSTYLYARNALQLESKEIQRNVTLADGTVQWGYEVCRQNCKDDPDCVGGHYSRRGNSDYVLCETLRNADPTIAPESEKRFWFQFETKDLERSLGATWLFSPFDTGFFSVCENFDADAVVKAP